MVLPKVTQCAVDLWCDSSENRSQCTRGYSRTTCSEDLADAPSSLLALCRTNDGRSVCGTSKWKQTCQEERHGDCEEPSQRFAMRGGSFQAYLGNLLEDVGFRGGTAAPSIYNRVDDNVKMSVHVLLGCHGPRLYVCQAPNAFICVSGVAPPKHQMRLYVCHQMRLYVCH